MSLNDYYKYIYIDIYTNTILYAYMDLCYCA